MRPVQISQLLHMCDITHTAFLCCFVPKYEQIEREPERERDRVSDHAQRLQVVRHTQMPHACLVHRLVLEADFSALNWSIWVGKDFGERYCCNQFPRAGCSVNFSGV